MTPTDEDRAKAQAIIQRSMNDPKGPYAERLEINIATALACSREASATEELVATHARLKELEDILEAPVAVPWPGMANLYRAITGKECDESVALGMATSAVSSMLAENKSLRTRLAEAETENERLKIRDTLFAQLRSQIAVYYGKGGGLAALQDGHRKLEAEIARLKEAQTTQRDAALKEVNNNE